MQAQVSHSWSHQQRVSSETCHFSSRCVDLRYSRSPLQTISSRFKERRVWPAQFVQKYAKLVTRRTSCGTAWVATFLIGLASSVSLDMVSTLFFGACSRIMYSQNRISYEQEARENKHCGLRIITAASFVASKDSLRFINFDGDAGHGRNVETVRSEVFKTLGTQP